MNLPRGKQSGIAYGQKKQQGQSDTEQLVAIASYLRKKYKVKVKREPYVIFDQDERMTAIVDNVKRSQVDYSYAIRNPDLMWFDKYGCWIIEVDGAVHDRKVQKTLARNELFISNGIKLIVVNLADLKELGLNIYDYIDSEILKRIKE